MTRLIFFPNFGLIFGPHNTLWALITHNDIVLEICSMLISMGQQIDHDWIIENFHNHSLIVDFLDSHKKKLPILEKLAHPLKEGTFKLIPKDLISLLELIPPDNIKSISQSDYKNHYYQIQIANLTPRELEFEIQKNYLAFSKLVESENLVSESLIIVINNFYKATLSDDITEELEPIFSKVTQRKPGKRSKAKQYKALLKNPVYPQHIKDTILLYAKEDGFVEADIAPINGEDIINEMNTHKTISIINKSREIVKNIVINLYIAIVVNVLTNTSRIYLAKEDITIPSYDVSKDIEKILIILHTNTINNIESIIPLSGDIPNKAISLAITILKILDGDTNKSPYYLREEGINKLIQSTFGP